MFFKNKEPSCEVIFSRAGFKEGGTVCYENLLDQSKNVVCTIKIRPHLFERFQNDQESPL